jgi:hypothetical protein
MEQFRGDRSRGFYAVAYSGQVLVVFFGVSVALFLVAMRSRLKGLAHWQLFAGAYAMALIAWTADLVDAVMQSGLAAGIEGAAYALSALLLAGWCWMTLRGGQQYGRAGHH